HRIGGGGDGFRSAREVAPGPEGERRAECTATRLPGARSGLPAVPVLAREFVERGGEHRGDGGDLVVGGVASQDPDVGGVRHPLGSLVHSGMFPCFFGGCEERLVRRARSAFTIATRVAAGSM